MKVLQVYRDHFSDLPGGIERHVSELAQGLSDRFQMEILASSRRRRSSVVQEGAVRIHLGAELMRLQGLPICPTFPSTIRKGAFDIVHFHVPNPTGEVATMFARKGTRLVATYHADLHRAVRLFPLYRRFLDRVLGSCDRVIASSEQLVRRSPVLAAIGARHPHKIEIVPFGVDTERFSPGPTSRSEALRSSWGPGRIVLFVGRLRYYKGLTSLIRAMAQLDATLVVAGRGPERHRIERLGRSALGRRFILEQAPSEDELADLYRAADVFCLPSTSAAETFGLVAVEAMSCGVPVITTEVGTATSVVNQDAVSGLVVPPRSGDALAVAIDKILSDDELARRLAAGARARVLDLYDRVTMLDRVARIYRDVSAAGGPR